MTRPAFGVVLLALASACTGSSTAASADGGVDMIGDIGDSRSQADGGGDRGGVGDVGAPGSCLRIRACVSACADAACIQQCVALGTPDARALYAELQDCARAACPDAEDEVCRCQAECIFPGACTDLQDSCSEGMDDPHCVRCF